MIARNFKGCISLLFLTFVRNLTVVLSVFLVRPSTRRPGEYVLTYKLQGKVLHIPIVPYSDENRGTPLYSLDKGITKFYDLLQLVEFYQLNAGCLSTRLTHFVVLSAHNIKEPTSPSSQLLPSNEALMSFEGDQPTTPPASPPIDSPIGSPKSCS